MSSANFQPKRTALQHCAVSLRQHGFLVYISISKDIVAKRWGFGGGIVNKTFIADFLEIVPVKGFLKSANIW